MATIRGFFHPSLPLSFAFSCSSSSSSSSSFLFKYCSHNHHLQFLPSSSLPAPTVLLTRSSPLSSNSSSSSNPQRQLLLHTQNEPSLDFQSLFNEDEEEEEEEEEEDDDDVVGEYLDGGDEEIEALHEVVNNGGVSNINGGEGIEKKMVGSLLLSVKEKKELSAYAHSLGKKLKTQQVGKSGVTEAVAAALVDTLEANELLKLKVHNSCPGDFPDVVRQLEEATNSITVSQIGRTIVLYRPSIAKMKAAEKLKHNNRVAKNRAPEPVLSKSQVPRSRQRYRSSKPA